MSAPTTISFSSTTTSAWILWSSIMRAASTASLFGAIVFGRGVITLVTGVLRSSICASSSVRRRSPSVNTPSRRLPASTTAAMPRPLCVISTSVSETLADSRTRGTAWPVCMMSAMWISRRRPSEPAGCERAKSSAVKPRASSNATASASPITSAAVVLAVGARPSGHASSETLTSTCTSARRASVEPGLPVSAMSGTPWRRIVGTIISSSSVSPELDSAMTMSSGVIMPRSPWLASPGCTKNDGVPVEASVAAILRPMWPDLPMPDTTTRPRQASSTWQARVKSPLMREASSEMPRISTANTARALRSSCSTSSRSGGCNGRTLAFMA